MSSPARGLFRKAQSYLDSRKHLRLVRPGESGPDEGDIPPEEREKILAQIDEILARKRLRVTPETLRFTPRRRGGVLPIIVNLAAVFVIAAGIFLAVVLSRRDEQTIIAAPVALQTAEGKLLEAMKQESQQQLESKDKEIAGIREKLAGIDQETDRIRQDADKRVQAREKELQDQLSRSLDEERRKLEASGLSAEAVDRRVAQLEARSRTALEDQVASFRKQAEADRQEREKAIQQLKAGYEQNLAAVQGERSQLEQEASRKQAEMEAGYRQRQLALEKDKTQAQDELERMRANQEKEQMVLTQALGFYRKARDEIQASRPEEARTVLADLRQYLDQPDVAALPAIAQRRPVELFLIGSLEELIKRQATEGTDAESTQALVASASLVTAVASLVQQGDDLYQQQDYAKAREVYLSAMARIPPVRLGYDKLTEIEKLFSDRQKREVGALLAAGNAAYRAKDYERAVDRYGKALETLQGERGTVDTLIAQLEEIGSLTRNPASLARDPAIDARLASLEDVQRKRAAMLAQIASLRERYVRVSGHPAGTNRESLVTLLEAKLLVQKVLLSKEVIAQYPDLADRLNRYIEALVEERVSQARLDAISDLDTMLSGLIEKSGRTRGEPRLLSLASSEQKDTLLRILDKLQVLLQ